MDTYAKQFLVTDNRIHDIPGAPFTITFEPFQVRFLLHVIKKFDILLQSQSSLARILCQYLNGTFCILVCAIKPGRPLGIM
jgi:hypothetical protein